jgi:hypothetical protein
MKTEAEIEAEFEAWWNKTHAHLNEPQWKGMAKNIATMTKVIAKEAWIAATNERQRPETA